MTLQAKDLMIGDWVQLNGKPMQVGRINLISVNGKPAFCCGSPHIWSYNNDFNPIPLTQEILEKNGFGKLIADSKYVTYTTLNNKISCTLVKETKQWMLTIGAAGSVKKKFVEVSCVDFVHELQHALRLCGIEKEIEL